MSASYPESLGFIPLPLVKLFTIEILRYNPIAKIFQTLYTNNIRTTCGFELRFSEFLTIIKRNIFRKFGVRTTTPRQVINRRNPKIELNRKNQTAITFEPQVMRRRNSPVSLPLTRSRNGRNLEFVAVLLAELFQFENSTRMYLTEKSFENFSKSPLGNQRSRRSLRTANGRISKLAPRLTRVKGKTP